jgi:hypothetical protein
LLPPIDRFKRRILIWARMNRILWRTQKICWFCMCRIGYILNC